MVSHTEKLNALQADVKHLWSDQKNMDSIIEQISGHLTEDCKLHILGSEEFALAADVEGRDAVNKAMRKMFGKFETALDLSKPVNRNTQFYHQGGPGQWTVFESIGSGTTKKGKPFHNDTLWLLKQNSDGLWSDIKAYLDTKHLHEHIKEHEK